MSTHNKGKTLGIVAASTLLIDPTGALFFTSMAGGTVYYGFKGFLASHSNRKQRKQADLRRREEMAHQERLVYLRTQADIAKNAPLPPPPPDPTPEQEVREVQARCEVLVKQVNDMYAKGLIDEATQSTALSHIATQLRRTIIAILSDCNSDDIQDIDGEEPITR